MSKSTSEGGNNRTAVVSLHGLRDRVDFALAVTEAPVRRAFAARLAMGVVLNLLEKQVDRMAPLMRSQRLAGMTEGPGS